MSTPRAALPQGVLLAQEYAKTGISFEILARKYGCSPSTVRNRLREWTVQSGQSWPLKPHGQTRGQNRDVVPTDLVVREIHYATRTLRISQSTLARLSGLTPNHLHKITSAKVTSIQRATQGKILEAISKIEAGELQVAPEKVILPLTIRDSCPSGHRYTGRRDKTGRRICGICQAQKHRRREELLRTAKAS